MVEKVIGRDPDFDPAANRRRAIRRQLEKQAEGFLTKIADRKTVVCGVCDGLGKVEITYRYAAQEPWEAHDNYQNVFNEEHSCPVCHGARVLVLTTTIKTMDEDVKSKADQA